MTKDDMKALRSTLFLVLCKDGADGRPGFDWTLYLVNAGDVSLEDVTVDSGGFSSFDDELVTTSTAHKALGTVPAGGGVAVEANDAGDFDFVVGYTVRTRRDGVALEGTFSRSSRVLGDPEPRIAALGGRQGVVLRGTWKEMA